MLWGYQKWCVIESYKFPILQKYLSTLNITQECVSEYFTDLCVRAEYYTDLCVQILQSISAITRILHRSMSKNIMLKYVSEQIISEKYAYLCECNEKRYLKVWLVSVWISVEWSNLQFRILQTKISSRLREYYLIIIDLI